MPKPELSMPLLTFAFCTFNRADRLERLVSAMRAQCCPIPFEILAVNNNSTDGTAATLSKLASMPGAALRFVNEPVQGIVAARNRGLAEALNSDILVFLDDDELPQPGLLNAVCDSIFNEHAECVGGRVEVDFTSTPRPKWLEEGLLGFLAAVDHGPDPFWIENDETPIWTANIAYQMQLFRDDPTLRFDQRYDRVGKGVGGGEDVMMFRNLLQRGIRMRYRPDMIVLHSVENWRLKRHHFLRLHYLAGKRRALYDMPNYANKFFGVPPFMAAQFVRQVSRTVMISLTRREGHLRQAMNAAYAWGAIIGYAQRDRQSATHTNRDT